MLKLECSSGEPVVVTAARRRSCRTTDQLSYSAALVVRATPGRLSAQRPEREDQREQNWQDLVGINDIASYSPAAHRGIRGLRESLRVPVGTMSLVHQLKLDIKEAAANGMGPHGLCVGATGSGKSEFLRTVALGMIVGHSPEELNLVLVDFKGGATFSGLETAPHVAAVITNLSDKAALVARMRDALMGEMNRRQEVLREAGNLDGICGLPTQAARRMPGCARCRLVHHRRRVLRIAQPTSRFRRCLRRDRPVGTVAGHTSFAGQSASGRRQIAWFGIASVVPSVPENLVGQRISDRAGNVRGL